jgi:hypothetical protein
MVIVGSTRRVRPGTWVEAAVLLLFVLLVAATAGGVTASRFPDSATYLEVDLTGESGRLPVVPVLFALASNDGVRIGLQVIAAAASWGLLAVAVRRSTRTRLVGWLAMCSILVLPLAPALAEWNVAILSESLTISLSVATLATWSWWIRTRHLGWLVAATVVTTAFVLTRHLHIPIGAAIALGLLVAALRSKQGQARGWAAGVLLVACAVSGVLAVQNREIPRSNAVSILVDRIAERPAALRYFRDHGLPAFSDRQQDHIGDYLGNEEPFLGDRRLVRWVDDRFLSTYARFLASRPSYLLGDPLENTRRVVATPAGYGDPRRVLPSRTDALLYGWRSLQLLVIASAVAALAAARSRAFRRAPAALLGVAAIVTAAFWVWSVFLLSANELPRLGVPAGVMLRVGLLLVLTAAVDALAGPRVRDHWLARGAR